MPSSAAYSSDNFRLPFSVICPFDWEFAGLVLLSRLSRGSKISSSCCERYWLVDCFDWRANCPRSFCKSGNVDWKEHDVRWRPVPMCIDLLSERAERMAVEESSLPIALCRGTLRRTRHYSRREARILNSRHCYSRSAFLLSRWKSISHCLSA